jgi:hypothetical protein
LLSALLLVVLVLPLLLLSALLLVVLVLPLLLSVLLFGLGLLLPALLLFGMVFLVAPLLLLCVGRSSDSEKQTQDGCAGESNYFHLCYLRYCWYIRLIYRKFLIVALTGLPMASVDTRNSTLRFGCPPPELSCGVYVLIALALGKYWAIDRSADAKGKLQLTLH